MRNMRQITSVERHFNLSFMVRGTILSALVLAATGAAQARDNNLSDRGVQHAVEDRIYFDSAVPHDRIDVSAVDGIVTLQGTTNSILAKERAARLAETIKGVRAVVNRITVKPTQEPSAKELTQDVERALQSDAATDSYKLTAKADDQGQVTLSGTVDSWQSSQLAKQVAMSVRGVTGVTNNIAVNFNNDRPDKEIQPEIEKTLAWDALVDSTLIGVQVKDGKVKLTGTVGSAAERRRALADAWVAGVTDVDTEGLDIADWARHREQRSAKPVVRDENELRQAINDANLYDPRVSSFNVTPSLSGSTVTLRGEVDNLKAKRAAAQNARNTVGVQYVINRLKVRPTHYGTGTAGQAADAVRDALLRDPYVDRYKIDVSVIDGTAYLSGRVDSYFEKAQAEDDAARINGVTEVSNALTVTNVSQPLTYDPYVYDWYLHDYDWYDYTPNYTAKPDRDIKAAIESELWWSPFVDSDEVNVAVSNGVATLTGTVDSYSERRAAESNALEGGAVGVYNDLVVASR